MLQMCCRSVCSVSENVIELDSRIGSQLCIKAGSPALSIIIFIPFQVSLLQQRIMPKRIFHLSSLSPSNRRKANSTQNEVMSQPSPLPRGDTPPSDVSPAKLTPVEPIHKAAILFLMYFAHMASKDERFAKDKDLIIENSPRLASIILLRVYGVDVAPDSIERYYSQAMKQSKVTKPRWKGWGVVGPRWDGWLAVRIYDRYKDVYSTIRKFETVSLNVPFLFFKVLDGGRSSMPHFRPLISVSSPKTLA